MTAIELQGAYNVRDLGGLRTKDRRLTRPGVIYRGDSLDNITPADAKILFDKLGIGTIVDLRTKAETERLYLDIEKTGRPKMSQLVDHDHDPDQDQQPQNILSLFQHKNPLNSHCRGP